MRITRINKHFVILLSSPAAQKTMEKKAMFVALLMGIFLLEAFAASEQSPPNILFMMADQMRADVLSCAGNTAIRTPNLDKLAAEGVRFSNAFSSTPSCTPARAAILTGLSPWYHGMLGYGVIATRCR